MNESQDDRYLRIISDHLGEINKNLKVIVILLTFTAIGAMLAGRAAVLAHGIWGILGF